MTQKMEMVNLQKLHNRHKEELHAAMLEVFENGQFINGPQVGEFANNLGEFINSKYVIPCGNGTDALQLALMALDLEPGDEVITTTFSFVATAEVIALLGLKPVFVDVDDRTYNISPKAIESAITDKTKVILPVHLFGQSANMNAIMKIAEKHNLFVIEDAAQALGATYTINRESKYVGTIGHIGCTSFFPSKNLGGFGDGGACFTQDEELANKIRTIANHGSTKRYFHDVTGVNSRLDTMQAAMLNVKLKYFTQALNARAITGEHYNNQLIEIDEILIPRHEPLANHTYNQYTIRVLGGKRDELKNFLQEKGIPSRVYYPLPLHKQKAFENNSISIFPLENSDILSNEVLSLPIHTEIIKNDVHMIAKYIKDFFV